METKTSHAVITAVGLLHRSSVPNIRGLDEFDGPSFHTTSWPRDPDLRGKRVAMIGTGASGMLGSDGDIPAIRLRGATAQSAVDGAPRHAAAQ